MGDRDELFHDVRREMNRVTWKKYRNHPYQWYYAENGLYLVRRISDESVFPASVKPPEEVYFVTGTNPQKALQKVLKLKEAAENGQSGDDKHPA